MAHEVAQIWERRDEPRGRRTRSGGHPVVAKIPALGERYRTGLEDLFAEFARGMRERGHFFTPDSYKRQHLSWAHGKRGLEAYLTDAGAALGSLDSG